MAALIVDVVVFEAEMQETVIVGLVSLVVAVLLIVDVVAVVDFYVVIDQLSLWKSECWTLSAG